MASPVHASVGLAYFLWNPPTREQAGIIVCVGVRGCIRAGTVYLRILRIFNFIRPCRASSTDIVAKPYFVISRYSPSVRK
jgi:hypothetical protein